MDAVEEVKQRLNIEDVIGEYVQLKRAGRNWKGLSPFTSERSPSFMVSPEKQIWHDFSSGKGGNVFSFVMEMEGLDFREALELLARKAGVDLEQFRGQRGSGRGKEKERLYELLEAATHFYQVQFSKNQLALTYVFKKRQFTKETALEWRLGYSPNTGGALLDFLKTKGFTEAEAQAAGLTARAYRGGTQDMFRGRLMIPLQDPQGRVIGFTARLLADDADAPKYINTPQTMLYDKSRHVYGLHLAKEAIRKNKYAVVAEGNLDVIASHQVDTRQVVATAGTALTEPHLKALSRFNPDIRLCFDADRAGINATERAIPIASKVGVNLSVISIPSGKDPDELIKQDPAIWKGIIEKPQYALDWLIQRYQKELDITSAQGKRQFTNIILEVVNKLDDEVEKEHYINKLSQLLQVSSQALLSKSQEAAPRRLKKNVAPKVDRKTAESLQRQKVLLAITLVKPKLRSFLEHLATDMFAEPDAKVVLTFLQTHPDFVIARDVDKLQEVKDYVKILVYLYETSYQEVDDIELGSALTKLQANLIVEYTNTQEKLLNKAYEQTENDETRAKIRKKLANVTQLRKAYYGKTR
jgi:DNA primase